MWLIKKRQSWSYVVLGVMFDVSWKSASNYCDEIQAIFVETLLGRLFYLPYAEDIEPEIPSEVAPLSRSRDLGYITVGMQIDPNDWASPGVEDIVNRSVEQADAKKGNIVLLHDA